MFLGLCQVSQAGTDQVIRAGWFEWEPYNYALDRPGYREMTGLDVELARAALHQTRAQLSLVEMSWEAQMQALADGSLDMATGAVPEDAPADKVYISAPYRKERIRLHVLRGRFPNIQRATLSSVTDQLRRANVRLGACRSYSYGGKVDAWLKTFDDSGLLFRTANEHDLLRALEQGEIAAFVADELVIATIGRDSPMMRQVDAHPLLLAENNVHVLFSRKTVTQAQVNRFNEAMAEIHQNGTYQKLVRGYFYPLILRQVTEHSWYYWLEMIGVLAAGASGLLFARHAKFGITGAIILVFVAALGGGFLRDLISERSPNLIIANPNRVWTLLGLAVVGYLALRLCDKQRWFQSSRSLFVADVVLECSDALGKAAFTVFGVAVALQTKCEPLYLWGPSFAVLTSLGGGVVRDIVSNKQESGLLKKGYASPIIFAWGLAFSLVLQWDSNHPETSAVAPAFIATMIGVFVNSFGTRLRDIARTIGKSV